MKTPLSRSDWIKITKISLGILIAVIIISYAIWRSLAYTKGPQIIIISPANGSSIATSTTILRGKVERANDLYINDRMTPVDEDGNFSETLMIFPGINRIKISAKDQFGRSVNDVVEVVFDGTSL